MLLGFRDTIDKILENMIRHIKYFKKIRWLKLFNNLASYKVEVLQFPIFFIFLWYVSVVLIDVWVILFFFFFFLLHNCFPSFLMTRAFSFRKVISGSYFVWDTHLSRDWIVSLPCVYEIWNGIPSISL